MAIKCAWCGRADLMQAEVNVLMCLACGHHTDFTGKQFHTLHHGDVPTHTPELRK